MALPTEGTRDWSSLPSDIVQLIANKLPAVEELVALTCVCRSFRSSIKKDQWRSCGGSQLPWLLLSCHEDNYSENDQRIALSMYKKKIFHMDLLELHRKTVFGTPYGWVVTLGLDLQLHLFNPLNHRRIDLPPPNVSPGFTDKYTRYWTRLRFIQRAILIKRPPSGSDDHIVVASGNWGEVSVLRPQKFAWETVIWEEHSKRPAHDIAYYNGQIYVVDKYGGFVIFSNLDGPGPLMEVRYVPGDYKELHSVANLYLLESSGDLLLVAREKDENRRTCAFNVFELSHQTDEWIVVDDLGDRTLFVGDSQSISLPSTETFNCRSNCIYFTEDDLSINYIYKEKERDVGVFDLRSRTIQPFFTDFAGSLDRFSDATWFIPMFS